MVILFVMLNNQIHKREDEIQNNAQYAWNALKQKYR